MFIHIFFIQMIILPPLKHAIKSQREIGGVNSKEKDSETEKNSRLAENKVVKAEADRGRMLRQ